MAPLNTCGHCQWTRGGVLNVSVNIISLLLMFLFIRFLLDKLRGPLVFDSITVMSWYWLVAASFFSLFYLFTNMGYSGRYALFYTVYAVPALFLAARLGALGRRGTALLCAAYLFIGSVLLAHGVFGVSQYNAEVHGIAKYLVQHSYERGYATYWKANILTELSDGRLEVYAVEGDSLGEPYKWLQKKDHIGHAPEGRIFIIVSNEERKQSKFSGLDDEHLLMTQEQYLVYGYDSLAEAMQEEEKNVSRAN